MSNQLHPVLLYIESRLFSKIIKKFSNKVLIEWTLNIFFSLPFSTNFGKSSFPVFDFLKLILYMRVIADFRYSSIECL